MNLTHEELTEAFEFLDDLREEGVTNMFGARPYLVAGLGLSDRAAGDALQAWMRTFSRDVAADERAQKALA